MLGLPAVTWPSMIALIYLTINVVYVFYAAGVHPKINGCFVYDTVLHFIILVTGHSSSHCRPTQFLHIAAIGRQTEKMGAKKYERNERNEGVIPFAASVCFDPSYISDCS